MKKLTAFVLSIVLFVTVTGCAKKTGEAGVRGGYPIPTDAVDLPDGGPVKYDFYAAPNGYFYRNDKGKSELFYIRGVNMGLTAATTDLSNPDVSYDTYCSWFEKISEMNANTVRVFTVMNPNFYKAFSDYNEKHKDSPLYLVQGIWFSEDLMTQLTDALESDKILINAFKRSVRETVDIVHGNSDYTVYGEFSPAVYDEDISKYVVGYILGLEYPSEFVIETNASHPNEADFTGNYLYTNNAASPFEAFLCEVGETLIQFETDNYSHQTPVSFLNWQTLDVLSHSNEPFEEEDEVSVNTENILSTSSYVPGLFAAVDVYPYYPEFMNYQKEYLEYKDENGNADPYRAYLKDLKKQYSVPVLIAEYGLSTSRGIAHVASSGYNQGGLTEEQQGEYCAQMTDSIAREGFCGGLLFSWQDEWFKRTWNTTMYYPDDPTERTHNLSSAEQSYGLLSFDVSECYPDGDFTEWEEFDKIKGTDLKVRYDADYMHIYADLPDKFDFENDEFYIPVSVLGVGSMKSTEHNISFDGNCDFLLVINGKENTRVLCDAYEDVFTFKYSVQKKVFKDTGDMKKDSGVFKKIQTLTSNEMYLPDNDKTIPPRYYESGLLRYGIANPESEKYCSQADFYYKNGKVEIRLAWYLLNVMNARLGVCMDEFNSANISFTNFDEIRIGSGQSGNISLFPAYFEPIENMKTTERLKQSYGYMQSIFGKIEKITGFDG